MEQEFFWYRVFRKKMLISSQQQNLADFFNGKEEWRVGVSEGGREGGSKGGREVGREEDDFGNRSAQSENWLAQLENRLAQSENRLAKLENRIAQLGEQRTLLF